MTLPSKSSRASLHLANMARYLSCAAFTGLASLATMPTANAQVGFPPPPPKVSPAAGVIDMHVHSDPDVFGRALTDVEVALVAKRKGLRGILLKNHVANTADRAALAMNAVPGIEIWGGIVLNNAVGGINPAAVEWMHRMSGGRGKVVWLPTFDSEKHVQTLVNKDAKGLRVVVDGKVTPQTDEVLKIIARENLLLATGHVSAEEVVAVTRRAKELGVKNIIVTHGLTNIPGLSMEQAKQVVAMGAVIEICYLQFMTGHDAQYAWMKHWSKVAGAEVATAVKELGAEGLVLSTDLGQQGMMTNADGLENMIAAVKATGVTDAQIDIMMRKNPARLLAIAN